MASGVNRTGGDVGQDFSLQQESKRVVTEEERKVQQVVSAHFNHSSPPGSPSSDRKKNSLQSYEKTVKGSARSMSPKKKEEKRSKDSPHSSSSEKSNRSWASPFLFGKKSTEINSTSSSTKTNQSNVSKPITQSEILTIIQNNHFTEQDVYSFFRHDASISPKFNEYLIQRIGIIWTEEVNELFKKVNIKEDTEIVTKKRIFDFSSKQFISLCTPEMKTVIYAYMQKVITHYNVTKEVAHLVVMKALSFSVVFSQYVNNLLEQKNSDIQYKELKTYIKISNSFIQNLPSIPEDSAWNAFFSDLEKNAPLSL